ncbi:coiled-coil-helix-coiled-coil-helix domain containing 3a [Salvelinus namaycush]|uniref:Coiled-coil-helix-coiled-coil-helix domain containing 3a n=1 Tax=Salvelinus namaycush TaxID=8040 RepID=A0A8U0UGD0_SALNM|nr:coiled-coil-helix-coiled-coil-helix domain containing 3a [Salvelinus namaycush]
MGANNSTRRVSFESDENDNITVVKGIRLSENVINRMREPIAPLLPPSLPQVPPPVAAPSPLLIPVPPLRPPFDPITSLPPIEPIALPPQPPAPVTEVVAPPPLPPPMEQVAAPTIIDMVIPPPTLAALKPVASPQPPASVEQPPVEAFAPPPAPEPVEVVGPPLPPPTLEPEPVAAAAHAVDEEELRKKITEDLQKGLLKERAKAEQELQAWLEEEKVHAASFAEAEAQASVKEEVGRILELERATTHNTLTQAVMREKVSAEDERLRTQLYAKQLELRDQELKKQDAFYREQVARLEDRSAQFYKMTTENYHKAADGINAKFKRFEVSPVCADLQGQILKCYQEHSGKTLLCSTIASRYLQCVNQAKQNKLRTGG